MYSEVILAIPSYRQFKLHNLNQRGMRPKIKRKFAYTSGSNTDMRNELRRYFTRALKYITYVQYLGHMYMVMLRFVAGM